MKEEDFSGKSGTRIHFRSWRPASPKAVVVIAHGVNSHGGQYLWTGEQLEAAGFTSITADAGSPKARGSM